MYNFVIKTANLSVKLISLIKRLSETVDVVDKFSLNHCTNVTL